MRRLSALLVVALFAGHLTAAAQTPATPQAASDADAAKVTETLTTWLKRAGSDKPEVRLRAWNSLTEGYQQFFLPEGPDSFAFASFTVYSVSDNVTVEPTGHFGVEVNLSGFINPHGLYSMKFLLTPEFKIDDQFTLPKVEIPKDMTATYIRAVTEDGSVRVDHPTFTAQDVTIVRIVNKGTATHTVVVFHLNDGKTVDELATLVAAAQPGTDITSIAVTFGVAMLTTGATGEVGMLADPGTYVLIGITPGDSVLGMYDVFTLK